MAGHSHWAGIKHKKGVADQKRGQLFSKILAGVTAAARHEPNPDFNPRLRTLVQKAKDNKVPLENIQRAISRSKEAGAAEECIFEAYGPEGAALIIEVVTDNRNRSVAEIKKTLSDNDAKWAEVGSVRWSFEVSTDGWIPKFFAQISPQGQEKLNKLIAALENRDDVHGVYINATDIKSQESQ